MNWTEAYCKAKGISKEKALDILKSPALEYLKDYLKKSKEVGYTAGLNNYDVNVTMVLKGELRTIMALEILFDNLLNYSLGISSEPVDTDENQGNPNSDNEIYQKTKEPIKIQ